MLLLFALFVSTCFVYFCLQIKRKVGTKTSVWETTYIDNSSHKGAQKVDMFKIYFVHTHSLWLNKKKFE
jgi:hypothetical protein